MLIVSFCFEVEQLMQSLTLSAPFIPTQRGALKLESKVCAVVYAKVEVIGPMNDPD